MEKIKISIIATEYIAFVSLLVTSFLLVSTQVKSFWDGKTIMIESKRPLSVDDMPALAICFKALRNLKYGQDLKIVAHIPTTATLNTLKMGFIQIEDRLVHLKRLSLHPMMSTSTIRKHCFVLNFRF